MGDHIIPEELGKIEKVEAFSDNFQDVDLNANEIKTQEIRYNNSTDPLTSISPSINHASIPIESNDCKVAILNASQSETKNLKTLTSNGHPNNEAIVKPFQNGQPIKPGDELMPYVMAKCASPELRHKPKGKLDGTSYGRGDLMVTIKPIKSSCVWVTPAKFDVNSVPVEFMDPKLSITADDYNLAMEFLTNDYRFNCYNICYRRIILLWLLFGFLILIAILFSRLEGAVLFGMGIVWLLINTVGIFVCLFIKKRMNVNLDDAVSMVNRMLIKRNILAGLEDQGKLSCHKIMTQSTLWSIIILFFKFKRVFLNSNHFIFCHIYIHFVYYDIGDCMTEMTQILEKKGLKNKGGKDILSNGKCGNGGSTGGQYNLDVEKIIDGNSTNLKLNHYQNYAEKVLLRNSQSYIKNLVKGRLTIPHPELPTSKNIRHVKGNFCLCQYVEDYYFSGKESKWYHTFF